MGKTEKAWVWKQTSLYQEEGLLLLGFSDWRLSHFSLVSFWQNRLGFFCLPLHMQHLIPRQGKAQVEMHSHAGTGLRRTVSRRRCSCRTWFRPTSFLSLSFGPREVIYTELYSRLKLSLLLQQYYFPVSAFPCPRDTGSAPVACAHLGERAIHHRQETCCTQQVSSHLLLLLQWGPQILKRCITCTLQTAIHHRRAVPQTPRHSPASCSSCVQQWGTSPPTPHHLAVKDKSTDTESKTVHDGFCYKNYILSLSSRKAQCCKGAP